MDGLGTSSTEPSLKGSRGWLFPVESWARGLGSGSRELLQCDDRASGGCSLSAALLSGASSSPSSPWLGRLSGAKWSSQNGLWMHLIVMELQLVEEDGQRCVWKIENILKETFESLMKLHFEYAL